LETAKTLVGTPFSVKGMCRAPFFPGKTDPTKGLFCAELVSLLLKTGGLLCTDSNPAAATPTALYHAYVGHASISGNPHTLSQTLPPVARRCQTTLQNTSSRTYNTDYAPVRDVNIVFKLAPL